MFKKLTIDRDTLLCKQDVTEKFLKNIMSIFVTSHYKVCIFVFLSRN